MSAGNISLNSSIRSCRIDTGWADRMASDRFLNPDLVVAPAWSGYDAAGRPAHPDSFNTKTAGGASAMDRVAVENGLRPRYAEFVTLSARGIEGVFPESPDGVRAGASIAAREVGAARGATGRTGQDLNAEIRPRCGPYRSPSSFPPTVTDIYANNAYAARHAQSLGVDTAVAQYKTLSGAY